MRSSTLCTARRSEAAVENEARTVRKSSDVKLLFRDVLAWCKVREGRGVWERYASAQS